MEFLEIITAMTIFGSIIWFWIIVGLFVIVSFYSDSKEAGYYSFIAFVIISILYSIWGELPYNFWVLVSVKNVGLYIGIGLVYAIIRTLFEGVKLGHIIKTLPTKEEKNADTEIYCGDTKESAIEDYIHKLYGNLTRWILIWWVSIISWMFKDVRKYITKGIKSIFVYILKAGMKTVK